MGAKKKSKSKWAKRLFFCFVVYFLIVLAVQQVTMSNIKKETAQIEDKLNDIQRTNKEQKEQIEIVGTPEYMEYLVRLKKGWVKPDEKKFVESDNEQ